MASKSKIFHTSKYREIETNIVTHLNDKPDYISKATASSTRAVGDAIQEILSAELGELLGGLGKEYTPTFARRAMADLAFKDIDDLYYVVDVKTHRLETSFNMPNITSVKRLSRFYEDDDNYYVVLFIVYNIDGTRVVVEKTHFVPIEFLSWDCLTIGALGWGQIQISNSNVVNIKDRYPRKKWMIELCDVMLEFYPKEISKIGGRIEYFEKVKRFWEEKPG
jgi:hypothetical protein